MSERSTFSPFWHRVRVMRPRLRPLVQVVRQRYRGKRWYVAMDPSSNGFYRLGPVAYEFVAMLDGKRTVEEVWQHNLTKFGDESLTQNDVVQVLSQLHQSNLLQSDHETETEQLLTRGRERFKKKALAQAVGLMYFRVPLFNPNRLLDAIEPIFRPFMGRVAFLAWLGLLVAALVALVPHWGDLRTGFSSAIAPSNWGWLLAIFIVLKLWHELGHGLMTKRFGGQVPVLGAMMLVLIPSPYVDATAAWGFKNKWHRIAVGGAGMMFELFVAAVAAFVWIATKNDGGLVHQLSYNVLLTASVTTIIFNANPLMKFDGYFMLSDLIEVPNLMPRSMNMLKFLFQKHLYRVEQPLSPTSDGAEAGILLTYGLLALAYRVFLFISITLYVVGIMFGLGVILAIWTAVMWFVVPLGQWIHWLATNSQLTHKRTRAVWASVLMVGAGVALLGALPMPDRRRADAVVESAQRSGLFSLSAGTIGQVHVQSGDRVEPGQAIITIDSPELTHQLRFTRAQLDEATLRLAQAGTQQPAAAQVAEQMVNALHQQVALLEDRLDKLVVRAPQAGVVVLAPAARVPGTTLEQGASLGEVLNPEDLRIAAVLTQEQADWLGALPPEQYRVEGRRLSRLEQTIPLRVRTLPAAARRDLPHAALGFGGGGTIQTRADDKTAPAAGNPEDAQRESTRPIFRATFVANPTDEEHAPPLGEPGERVKLRFTLPRKPLLAQWWQRLEQTLQGRAQV